MHAFMKEPVSMLVAKLVQQMLGQQMLLLCFCNRLTDGRKQFTSISITCFLSLYGEHGVEYTVFYM